MLRQFRRLEILLAGEIGEPPLPETVEAYRAAMAAAIDRSRRQVAASTFRTEPALSFAVGS